MTSEMGRTCIIHGRVSVGRPEGERPLRRPRRRREDNINVDLREVDYLGNWTDFA